MFVPLVSIYILFFLIIIDCVIQCLVVIDKMDDPSSAGIKRLMRMSKCTDFEDLTFDRC